jgi:hypothetical protein
LVRRGDIIDEIEADHRIHTLDPGNRADDVLDLRDNILGPVDRRALRQPHRGKEGALILSRQKALCGDPEQSQ